MSGDQAEAEMVLEFQDLVLCKTGEEAGWSETTTDESEGIDCEHLCCAVWVPCW